MTRIAVIGAGSWGTALAKLLADKGNEVMLWAHEPEVVMSVNRNHRNALFLSSFRLPAKLRATSELSHALHQAEVVLSVVPSHFLRRVWQEGRSFLSPKAVVVSCTKGIEEKSFKLMSQVLDEVLDHHPFARRAVLSGPSFAEEVAKRHPTSVVIAGSDPKTLYRLQQLFRTPFFLPFASHDMIGVQIGGAIKNIIAIAAGLSEGLRLGLNARAAIITRGLYEMIKIGSALGANQLTFAGLSGIGDLVLTCTDQKSRNFSVGKALGEGRSIAQVLSKGKMVAEGMGTAHAVVKLGRRLDIPLPICTAVHSILEGRLKPRAAVAKLSSMPLGMEMGALFARIK